MKLTLEDLERLDVAEFIEGDEWDYEWHLEAVSLAELPVCTETELAANCGDEETAHRFTDIREWFSAMVSRKL